jgi:extracellular factor (EF) 3-hydroxypalmitic acid methyl ester biosynthesis protein
MHVSGVMIMNEPQVEESLVLFKAGQDAELRGKPLRMTRFAAAFELYGDEDRLRLSEALHCFRIMVRGRTIYAGRAVVRSLIETGPLLVCEVALDESAWRDLEFDAATARDGWLREKFNDFLSDWQTIYRIAPEFKAVLADMQSFLMELRLWLNQLELGMASMVAVDRARKEREVIDGLTLPVVSAIGSFVERFEAAAGKLEEERHPGHQAYLRRQLHPLLLCSPFAHRAYYKPLGYAGDYEVVNMMLRPSDEGNSLFAKMLNVWLIGQAPAQAHRNRVGYLKQKLLEEALRLVGEGRSLRVFNLGCGPAHEVKLFLGEETLADRMDLTLVDFNEETLVRLQGELDAVQRQQTRKSRIQFVKKSVHQLLKESSRKDTGDKESLFDFIYCAGLYDYLSDQVCRRLNDFFYSKLAPGGLLLTTNVTEVLNDSRPFRYSMEYMLDWMLIYRDGRQFAALKPEAAPPDSLRVITEETGVNLFMEVRKPTHA